MSDRDLSIPKTQEPQEMDDITKEVASQVAEQVKDTASQETKDEKKVMTQEESDFREKVFFEEDEKVRLRDGKTYHIPPLGLRDARKLMKLLNTIDSGVIIANFIPETDDEEDRYEELLEVLLMAFKPYYSHMTVEHLAEYVDLDTAKKIIDCMIGLNGIKKSM